MVGDGDPMRVRAQVAKHLVGSAKGWLAVDDPVMPEQLAEELWEQLRLSEGLEPPVELEFAGREGLFQGLHEICRGKTSLRTASGRKKPARRRMDPLT